MDSNTGGILGIFAFLTSGAGLIYAAVNHKRIRCRCCGRDLDMSVDVEPTDVPKDKKVKLPDPSSADTAPAALMEEALTSSNLQQEEEDETQIQYVEPKRKKKIQVYPG